ncbi:CDC16 protein [Savitreella phatthalungensis]
MSLDAGRAAAELAAFLDKRPAPGELEEHLSALKLHLMNEGMPAQPDGSSEVRALVWSLLLGVSPIAVEEYLDMLQRSASPAYQKIRNDTFRTLANDPLFKARVSEASLIRVLNSYAWRLHDKRDQNPGHVGYVQGMNILAAPFLYCCTSEVQAYALYSDFVERHVPTYVRPDLAGVHLGVKLVDRCLEQLDAKLYRHLRSRRLTAEVWAFPSIMTLSACTPPLPEVLVLWDFLLAYGVHMNVLCVIAQIILIREQLMHSQQPMTLLRKLPQLKGKRVAEIAVSFVPSIGKELYALLTRHTWDESLIGQL